VDGSVRLGTSQPRPAENYEKMLENHALTPEQRAQLMKMRDRRARLEAETRYTVEQSTSALYLTAACSSNADPPP
jgi:hypothetical protein